MRKTDPRYRDHSNRRSIILMFFVVAVLFTITGIQSRRLSARNQEYLAINAELEEKIEAEKQRTEELLKYREYTNTKEFIEWYAKTKLGLVKENEIIIKSE